MRKSEEESPEELCNELEELSEEPLYDSVSHQSSESEYEEIEEEIEELNEEQTEDTSEWPVSHSSLDIENCCDEESREEPDENPSEDSLSQSISETETDDSKFHTGSFPNVSKKKMSLEVTVGDSSSLQVHPTQKKRKQEECLEPEHGFALADLHNESSSPKAFINAENASEQKNCTGSSGKRRRSRWDLQAKEDMREYEGNLTHKRRKTRWANEDSHIKLLGPTQLPDFIKDIVTGADSDPEIQELEVKLLEINRKLQGSEVHDDRPEEQRSPSPPPVYDKLGNKMNSRDIRFRNKLVQDRHAIISKLIQKSSVFKPPPDLKPSNFCKKIYLPEKEYPGHNFIGLILGPCGNTQKRMQNETGATIRIRGKSSHESKKLQSRCSRFNDALHVLVEADNQKSFDEAVRMVEELLVPVDEKTKKHKREQLKELALLKGMHGDESLCKECGGPHKQDVCPNRKSSSEIDLCDICGGNSHPTNNCPLIASSVSNIESRGCSVAHTESGSRSFGTSTVSRSIPNRSSNCELFISPSCSHSSHPGVSISLNTEAKCSIEVNDGNVYVGNLPQTMVDNQLRELFSSFGNITDARVIKDRNTGLSKGYGFVKYDDPKNASAAVLHMRGRRIDGKFLKVEVSNRNASEGLKGTSLLPNLTGPSPVSHNSSGLMAWPGPPGSMLPEFQDAFL